LRFLSPIGAIAMHDFLLLYRLPADHVNDSGDVAAWNEWLARLGPDLTELGRPVTETASTGPGETALRLTGYSTIRAGDLAAAREIAAGCPAVAVGGAVEVGALMEMPEGHGPG
jgi:hypothetical protein